MRRRLIGLQPQLERDYARWTVDPPAPPTVEGPTLELLTPVCAPPPSALAAAWESLRAQTDPRWRWVVVCDGPQPAAVEAVLERAARDGRVRVVRRASRGGITAATQTAWAEGDGAWVGFLDHDDALRPGAVAWVRWCLARWPTVDVLYTDEDKLRGERRRRPCFKPGFDPLLLLGWNYACHFLVLRRACGEACGGIRAGFEGAQDHDFVLRAVEVAREVAHVPQVLYGWREVRGSTARGVGVKPHAEDAGRRAVEEALRRRGVAGARVEPGPLAGTYRPRWDPPGERDALVAWVAPGVAAPAGVGEVRRIPAGWTLAQARAASERPWVLWCEAPLEGGEWLWEAAAWPRLAGVGPRWVDGRGRVVGHGAGAAWPGEPAEALGYFGLSRLLRSGSGVDRRVWLGPREEVEGGWAVVPEALACGPAGEAAGEDPWFNPNWGRGQPRLRLRAYPEAWPPRRRPGGWSRSS